MTFTDEQLDALQKRLLAHDHADWTDWEFNEAKLAITSLRAKLAALTTRLKLSEGALNTCLATLIVENEWLREALSSYATQLKNLNDGPWGFDSKDFGCVARAALETKL